VPHPLSIHVRELLDVHTSHEIISEGADVKDTPLPEQTAVEASRHLIDLGDDGAAATS
jgi:hypothetical protein